MIKGRRRPRYGVLCCLLSWRSTPFPPQHKRRSTPFRVGMSDTVNTVLPLWMAQAGGFFAANGLNVELVNMVAAAAARRSCRKAASTPCGWGFSSVVQANRAGGDLRLIGLDEQRGPLHILLRSGRSHRARSQGRRCGREQLRSESDSTVTLALERLGLTRADITLKEYGGATRRLDALMSGEIRATAIRAGGEPCACGGRERDGRPCRRAGPVAVSAASWSGGATSGIARE